MLLVWNDKIYFSVIELESDAIPTVERQVLDLPIIQCIYVLSQQPKPATYPSIYYTFYLFDFAGATRLDGFEILIVGNIILFVVSGCSS